MISFMRYFQYYLKFLVKYVLLRLKNDYSFWKKLGVFDHGKMNFGEYSIGTFDFFYSTFTEGNKRSFKDITVVEIGPGDSVAIGILSKLHGARRSLLVDYGDFATRDMNFYLELIGPQSSPRSFDEMLISFDIDYGTLGLESLRTVASNSVDLIISNAVLEHIAPEMLTQYVSEFRRVLNPEGVMIHRIDYRDHLTGRKFHNSLPRFISHSRFYLNSIMYLNNLSEDDYLRMFLNHNFQLQVIDSKKLISARKSIGNQRSRPKNSAAEVASSCIVCFRV